MRTHAAWPSLPLVLHFFLVVLLEAVEPCVIVRFQTDAAFEPPAAPAHGVCLRHVSVQHARTRVYARVPYPLSVQPVEQFVGNLVSKEGGLVGLLDQVRSTHIAMTYIGMALYSYDLVGLLDQVRSTHIAMAYIGMAYTAMTSSASLTRYAAHI